MLQAVRAVAYWVLAKLEFCIDNQVGITSFLFGRAVNCCLAQQQILRQL